MKVNIVELREMVARAVQAMRTEAKRRGGGGGKKKDISPRTDKALELQMAKRLPTGFSYAPTHDYAEPLGSDSLYKKQGAAGIGGFTAVSPQNESVKRDPSRIQLEKLVEMVVREEIRSLIVAKKSDVK